MYYNKENVERLRQRYPEGTRICLDQMNDDPFPVESGMFVKVEHVDDIGTVHCVFDNGRTLGVIPGVDDFHIVSEDSEQTDGWDSWIRTSGMTESKSAALPLGYIPV